MRIFFLSCSKRILCRQYEGVTAKYSVKRDQQQNRLPLSLTQVFAHKIQRMHAQDLVGGGKIPRYTK